MAHTKNAHRNICREYVAKYAYLCGASIHAGTMSLIHYLTPRCSLLLVPLSVCVRMERILLILLETERQTDRQLDTHTNTSQLPTVYFCFSADFSHSQCTSVCICAMCVHALSPQSQLSTHHLCVTVIPLVVTYGTPLPCMEDLNRAL